MLPFLAAADDPAAPIGAAIGAPVGAAAAAQPAKTMGKVELDLEGAPFLEPDEPQQAKAEVEEIADAPPAEEAPKKSKKKLFIVGGGGLVLILAGVLYFFVFSGGDSEADKQPGQEVVVVRGPDWGESAVSQHMIDFLPFWVEIKDPEGEMRFLVCEFKVPTNSQANMLEINSKTTIIRDAVYYYLRNKTYDYLVDYNNQATIKKDVASIISDYLMSEKIEEILFENYLIK